MSTSKSSSGNGFSPMHGASACDGRRDDRWLHPCHHCAREMDYYLFGNQNVTTSELVARVLSRTYIDADYVAIVRFELQLWAAVDACMRRYSADAVNQSAASGHDLVDDSDVHNLVDYLIDDPLLSSADLPDSSETLGDDDRNRAGNYNGSHNTDSSVS